MRDGITGIVVEKDEDKMIDAVERLFTDKVLYETMCRDARKVYEAEHNLFQYGRKVGDCILKSNN